MTASPAPPQHILTTGLGWTHTTPPGRGVPLSGPCGWCDQDSDDLTGVLPGEFTQWSITGLRPDQPWLCRLCAAAIFAVKPIRWGHAQVSVCGDAWMTTDPRDLMVWLSRPVGDDRAVMVQTNRQKRSVLASAWGRVSTSYDQAAILWGEPDVGRLEALDHLRWDCGVSEREITEAAPRPKTLAAALDPLDFMRQWRMVKDWTSLHLEIGVLATRRTPQKNQ